MVSLAEVWQDEHVLLGSFLLYTRNHCIYHLMQISAKYNVLGA